MLVHGYFPEEMKTSVIIPIPKNPRGNLISSDNYRGRDANFQDAEIVRSEERHGLEPRAGCSGVQEQRHFGGPGEICHCISDIQKILQKNKLKPCLKITGCYLVFTLEKYELYLLIINTWNTKVKGLEMKYMMNISTQTLLL